MLWSIRIELLHWHFIERWVRYVKVKSKANDRYDGRSMCIMGHDDSIRVSIWRLVLLL